MMTTARPIRFIPLYMICASMGLVAQLSHAQHYHEGRYISAITHHIVLPEDGTRDEILSLSSEWAEAVLKQHPDILDIRYLLSATETDTLELLVLYEYTSAETARGAGIVIQELTNAHWPDAVARDAFFARMRRYINPNDNIRKAYTEIITSDHRP